MKRSFFTLLAIFLLNPEQRSYAQLSQLALTIGGSSFDDSFSMVQTTDGGYALSGHTDSYGAASYDMYVVKVDNAGSLQWTQAIGGTAIDMNFSVIQTSDGGYAAAGLTYSYGSGSCDFYIARLDNTGSLQWSQAIGGTGTEESFCVFQTTDGGYVMAGNTNSFGAGNYDFYVVKLDNTGGLQWTRTIGGTAADYGRSVVQISDGSYVVAGYTKSYGAGLNDVYVAKLNSAGTLQWSKAIGGAAGDEYGYVIAQTTDGGYVITGNTGSFGAGGNDVYVVKLNSAGALQWTRTVGGTGTEESGTLVQTTDGGFAIGGRTNSYGAGGNDMYLVKLNNAGALQWTKTIGAAGDQWCHALFKTSDGGFALSGHAISGNCEMYLVKLDAAGNCCMAAGSGGASGSGGTLVTPAAGSGSGGTLTSPSSNSGSGGVLTVDCALPSELLSFTVDSYEGTKVICSWVTATETANDYFIIERSSDGNNFWEAGRVKGAGNSNSEQHYSFVDHPAIFGVEEVYYRLRQVDYNGRYSYSQVVSLLINNEKPILKIYPTISDGKNTVLSISGVQLQAATIIICNIFGQEIFSRPVCNTDNLTYGFSQAIVIGGELDRGIYFVRVISGGRIYSERLIVE